MKCHKYVWTFFDFDAPRGHIVVSVVFFKDQSSPKLTILWYSFKWILYGFHTTCNIISWKWKSHTRFWYKGTSKNAFWNAPAIFWSVLDTFVYEIEGPSSKAIFATPRPNTLCYTYVIVSGHGKWNTLWMHYVIKIIYKSS